MTNFVPIQGRILNYSAPRAMSHAVFELQLPISTSNALRRGGDSGQHATSALVALPHTARRKATSPQCTTSKIVTVSHGTQTERCSKYLRRSYHGSCRKGSNRHDNAVTNPLVSAWRFHNDSNRFAVASAEAAEPSLVHKDERADAQARPSGSPLSSLQERLREWSTSSAR